MSRKPLPSSTSKKVGTGLVLIEAEVKDESI